MKSTLCTNNKKLLDKILTIGPFTALTFANNQFSDSNDTSNIALQSDIVPQILIILLNGFSEIIKFLIVLFGPKFSNHFNVKIMIN